jgi:pimeloyl-ACP methyl ester carboxylesterase
MEANMSRAISTLSIVGLLAVVGAFSLGVAQQNAQQNKDEKVDAGGYQVFTSQAGSGEPVIVFESGLGEDTSTWQNVQSKVAQFARTFTYDRAGLGKSDASSNAKTVEQMVKELHAVLNAAHVSPRYVLVGHSLGGAVVELYAHTYPDEVAGLVLVDPEDGRLLEQLEARLPKQEWQARENALAQMMAGASPAQKAEIEGSKKSGPPLAAALPLPRVPVVLLTGTLKDPSFPGNPMEQDLKLELQNEFLKNVPQSEHVLVPNSRHYIQDDAPQLVIDAIQKVVNLSKGGTRTGL